MSRKKFITYLLIILTLVMVIDVRYISSENHLFNGFITESIEEMIGMKVQYTYSSNSIKVEKEGNLKLGKDFLKKNEQIKSFNLKNDFGSIDLKGSQKKEINIDYTIKVHAEDKEAAEKFIQDLEIIYNLNDENLKINLNNSQTKTPELINVVEIDYRITIPEELKSSLVNQYGFVKVFDLKSDLEVKNSYGSTNIENIEGPVEVDLAYGNSKINNIDGKITADSKYGELQLSQIKDLALELSYADVKITSLKDYELYNYNLRADYGNIEANLGELNYNNQNQLKYQGQRAKYEIIINSKYGDINIK